MARVAFIALPVYRWGNLCALQTLGGMRIVIKLTNTEFATIDTIRNGRPGDSKAVNALMAWDLICPTYNGPAFQLTKLGQLAWEQNKPKIKVDKPKDTLYTDAVEYWLKEFHPGWDFGAIQGKTLKSILKKLRDLCALKVQNAVVVTDEMVLQLFKSFCQKLPDWFKDKDLPILDSKYNEIITKIQHGKEQNGFHSKNSADRFSDFAR